MSFIVVGVDGSATAQAALVEAVEQARARDAAVLAMNVVVIPAMSGYEFGPVDLEDMKAAGAQSLDDEVAKLIENYGGQPPVEIKTKVVTGHIGIELLRAARQDEGAIMVVTGSRGLGGFSSLLLGSVTTYLAHHLTCPLLIIPAVDEDKENAD